jgi:hypothetical protein
MKNPARLRPWKPTSEQAAAVRANDATFAWLCNLPPRLLHQYGGKWIAAKDCHIVASGDTFEELLKSLSDVPLQSVIIDRLRGAELAIYR